MVWQQWTYLILAVVGTAYMATTIGTPREPYSGSDMAYQIISATLLAALVLSI